MLIRNYPLKGELYLNGKIMELEVLRVSSQEDSTSGILFNVVDGKREFICYTLEDQAQDRKVMHETRIPEGTYELKFRTVGGHHARYTKRYGDMHKGCLHVIDVPNFKYILIHTGNTDDHTSGCLIVGETQTSNRVKKDGFTGSSTKAYKDFYPMVSEVLEKGEGVTITYINYA
mgnify:FL=1